MKEPLSTTAFGALVSGNQNIQTGAPRRPALLQDVRGVAVAIAAHNAGSRSQQRRTPCSV